jgi:hypothetical protein
LHHSPMMLLADLKMGPFLLELQQAFQLLV